MKSYSSIIAIESLVGVTTILYQFHKEDEM
jgi:hypothetical protein